MRKESYIARKRTLNSAKNASENGNPPMDTKGGSGEWESIWN